MHRFLPIVLLAGCLPALEDECDAPGDCPTGSICRSGLCVPIAGDAAPPDGDAARRDARVEGDGAPPDLDRGGPDEDGGRGDAGDARVSADAAADAGLDAEVDAGDGDALPDATGGDVGPCRPGAPEVCNGRDDDCDEAIDEGPAGGAIEAICYEGDPATRGVGPCRSGVARCVDGLFGACADQVLPAEVDVCDGVDDDCNGVVDDGPAVACADGDPALVGIGKCAAGERACVDGALGACLGAVGPAIEICDGADNDCDGATDEVGGCDCEDGASQVCYTGPPMTAGVGACRAGNQTCVDGLLGACADEVVPAAERCNEADDDCDGRVDESVAGVGEACVAGRGRCAAEGVVRCGAAGVACDAEPGDPVDERCNGLDDDCDGATDEDFALGQPCAVGQGACASSGVIACTADGAAACDAAPGDPRAEICSGADDDCDGATDEGELFEACFGGPPAAVGVGVCRAGARACDSDQPCVGEVLPTDEVCDGLDNDCDGEADEIAGGCTCMAGDTAECYDRGAGVPGTGICATGVRTCNAAGAYGPCVGAVGPQPETCDGRDEDCDGMIDDVPGRGGDCFAGMGVCRTRGTLRCVPGQAALQCDAVAGQPGEEVCNGLDDDCDGVVDNVAGVGAACMRGVGACARAGQRFCDVGLGRLACDAQPGPTADETCDDSDEDCDGTVDEAVVQPCDADCGVGRQTCQGGVFGACVGPPPGTEVCNEADDDCDGQVDEDVTNACGACGAPPVEVCNGADDDCDDAIDEGVANACGGCGAVPPETCDGADEDCDGNIDEGLEQRCFTDCGEGTEVCVVGQWRNCNAPQPQAEICNGMDDDCDTTIDDPPEDGDLCEPRPNADVECHGGQCEYGCRPLFFDADGQAANGCEHGCDTPAVGTPVPNVRGLDVALHFAPDGTRGVLVSSGDTLTLVLPDRQVDLALGDVRGEGERGTADVDAPALTYAGGRWIAVVRYTVTEVIITPMVTASGVAVFAVPPSGPSRPQLLPRRSPGPPAVVADPAVDGSARISVVFSHAGEGAGGAAQRSLALFRAAPGALANGATVTIGAHTDYRPNQLAAVLTTNGLGAMASWVNDLGIVAGVRFLNVGEAPENPGVAEWSSMNLASPPLDVAAVATGRDVYFTAGGNALRFGVVRPAPQGAGLNAVITDTVASAYVRPDMALGPHGPVAFAHGRQADGSGCFHFVIDPATGDLLGGPASASAPDESACEEMAVAVNLDGQVRMVDVYDGQIAERDTTCR